MDYIKSCISTPYQGPNPPAFAIRETRTWLCFDATRIPNQSLQCPGRLCLNTMVDSYDEEKQVLCSFKRRFDPLSSGEELKSRSIPFLRHKSSYFWVLMVFSEVSMDTPHLGSSFMTSSLVSLRIIQRTACYSVLLPRGTYGLLWNPFNPW